MQNRWAILLAFLVTCVCAEGQSAALVVVDQTGTAIPHAVVQATETGWNSNSDLNGRIDLSQAPKNAVLTVSAQGFHPATITPTPAGEEKVVLRECEFCIVPVIQVRVVPDDTWIPEQPIDATKILHPRKVHLKRKTDS
jgi:hypothetical protein